MCVVRINVTKNKLYWCHRYLLVQNADSRPDTKYRLETTDFTNIIKVDDVNNSDGKASLKRQKSPETTTDTHLATQSGPKLPPNNIFYTTCVCVCISSVCAIMLQVIVIQTRWNTKRPTKEFSMQKSRLVMWPRPVRAWQRQSSSR